MPLPNYVKFFKGTPEAYNNLKLKDEDALYFISLPEEGVSKLYIGSKLISGIGDVNEETTLLIQNIQSALGQKNPEGGSTGLYGEVEAINKNLDTFYLKTSDAQNLIDATVANAAHLKRKVVLELPKENIDENTIYMILKENAEANIADKYDEYIYSEATQGLEKVGSWDVDLSDYAKKSDFSGLQTIVTNHIQESEKKLTGLEAAMKNLDTTYISLNTFKDTIGDIQNLTSKKSNIVEAINSLDKTVTWETIL